jgi:putative FmdB family regulatory protein
LKVPVYDYDCLNCGKKFGLFFSYKEYGKVEAACTSCHSLQVVRRIGRIRVAKSDESRMADFSSPEALDGIDEDPQRLGGMMRRMSSQMGEDMGEEFNEVVGRLEKGDSPDQIEKDMPDLGSSASTQPGGEIDSIDEY